MVVVVVDIKYKGGSRAKVTSPVEKRFQHSALQQTNNNTTPRQLRSTYKLASQPTGDELSKDKRATSASLLGVLEDRAVPPQQHVRETRTLWVI